MPRKRSLTHLDSKGQARMVDVGAKPVTAREAVAEGFVLMAPATLRAIADEKLPKGDVLAAARIAGILAAKRTSELIPLCHGLMLESVEVMFDLPQLETDASDPIRLHIRASASIRAKTGVEMEALTAVSVAALTIYDMCKTIDKSMVIDGIRLLSKTGGRSGDIRRTAVPRLFPQK
jgi:cyclic pyranopterin phosphate synthase